MWNDSDKREDGNDDLSEMINAYSQDNELRRKINELKKQKEEEQSKPETTTYQSFIEDDVHPLPTSRVGGIPDIRVDDTMSKTRVGFEGESAYDKTLVIMNSKTKSSFQEGQTYVEPIYAEKEDEVESEDDAGKTMVTDFRTLKDANTLVQPQYEEDDEEEEEEEEAPRRRKGGAPDPEDNSKLNKIITYVIIGIVVVVLLIGGGFGVKYALDNWLSGDDTSDVEDSKDDQGSTSTNKPTTKPDTDTSKEPEKPNIDDNSAEKAKLQGELASLEQQLETKKAEVTTAEQAVADAKTNRESYSTQLSTLTTEVTNAKKDWDNAIVATKAAQTSLDNAKESDDKASLQTILDNAKKDEAAKKQLYEDKNTQLTNENKRYETQMKSLNEAVTAAEKTYKALKEEQTKLETSVATKTTELNKYN